MKRYYVVDAIMGVYQVRTAPPLEKGIGYVVFDDKDKALRLFKNLKKQQNQG